VETRGGGDQEDVRLAFYTSPFLRGIRGSLKELSNQARSLIRSGGPRGGGKVVLEENFQKKNRTERRKRRGWEKEVWTQENAKENRRYIRERAAS